MLIRASPNLRYTLSNRIRLPSASKKSCGLKPKLVNALNPFFFWLAKGLIKYSNVVTKAARNVANNMIDVMNNSISKISVDGLDSQPTIRPVFDMSSVEEGANAINGLFAKQQMVSLGIQNRGNINAISNAMKYGKVTTTNDDLVSAINDLKRAINGYSGNEYNINGITYDDGSNISNAVKSIIRAAKVERRR